MWQFVGNNHEQLEVSNPWEYPKKSWLCYWKVIGDLGIHDLRNPHLANLPIQLAASKASGLDVSPQSSCVARPRMGTRWNLAPKWVVLDMENWWFFFWFHHISPYFTIFHHISPYFTIFHHISPQTCRTSFTKRYCNVEKWWVSLSLAITHISD